MNKKISASARAVWLTLLSLSWAASAHAQDAWPSRPITMVVASGAGSGVDVMARELSQKLALAYNQPVIVDNKPGASGMVAGIAVVRAKPDGYTLLYSNGSFITVTPALVAKMNHDPLKDLAPVAQTAVGGVILMVNKDLPVNNLQELVALIKANPNKYTYGTWGIGTSGHLTTEWLKKKAGLVMEHVPYKTTPQIVNELASGVLQIGWSDPSTPVPMIEARQIKGIAMSGTVRVPRTPNVATMGEQGYPFDAVGWFGVFGPAELPAALVTRLNRDINRILKTPDMEKRMEGQNLEPPPNKSADEFKRIVARDFATWKSIATDINLKME